MDSFICWIGGKKRLRKQITELFPDKIEKYVEVFGGAGWVLFSKDKHAKIEIYNDYNSNLVNLYRCIKYHADALFDELEYIADSREMFYDCVSQMKARGLTDIQRAARFYVMVQCSYSGSLHSYGIGNRSLNKSKGRFKDIQQRSNRVFIENKDFEDIIKAQDKEGTLFYLDPPYYDAEKYYKGLENEFKLEDHNRLFEILKNTKAKWILSYNDDPYISNLYGDFTQIKVDRNNNMLARYDTDRNYRELIIKNF